MVSMWDAQNKKRISQMPGYETSIAALAFSRCCCPTQTCRHPPICGWTELAWLLFLTVMIVDLSQICRA